jgi:hypothetical protein
LRRYIEHWKGVVHVLCAASGEMHAHLDLYKAFLGVLVHQLECASEAGAYTRPLFGST